MYLTRFRFNTARREARSLLTRPQHLHAAVLHAFPEPERLQGEDSRILWRLDQDSRHSAILYVSSAEEPDLTHMVEQAGWPARGLAEGWDTRPYGKLLSALESGQEWAFRLTANPVHYVRPKPEMSKRWLPHVTTAQQLQWLLDRCERHGFSLSPKPDGEPNVVLHDRAWLRFQKPGEQAEDRSESGSTAGGAALRGNRNGKHPGDRRSVSIRTVTFDGVLKVENPNVLRQSLLRGIGKAKAYGCGMLTLAPLRQEDGRGDG